MIGEFSGLAVIEEVLASDATGKIRIRSDSLEPRRI